MFCRNCGASCADGARFCTVCGAPTGVNGTPRGALPPQTKSISGFHLTAWILSAMTAPFILIMRLALQKEGTANAWKAYRYLPDEAKIILFILLFAITGLVLTFLFIDKNTPRYKKTVPMIISGVSFFFSILIIMSDM